MTNHPLSSQSRSDALLELVAASVHPEAGPLLTDRWLALSGLQKAIRRGHHSFALQCGATLLQSEPDTFWRRLIVIAYEDMGIGNLDLLADLMSIAGRKAWRRQAGELNAASFFIARMCSAPKDRTCDDLVALADWDPTIKAARAAFCGAKLPFNLQLIANTGSISSEDAIAIWQRIGSRRYRAENIPIASGCYRDLLADYEAAGYPSRIIELCRVGLTRMSCSLPAYLPAVYMAAGCAAAHAVTLRPSASIEGIPAFVFDWFTRAGREAIRLWSFSDSGLRPALRWFSGKSDPVRAAAMAVFQLEGGRVNFEIIWPCRRSIADQTTVALLTSAGLIETRVPEFMELCQERLSILDEIRFAVVGRRNG